MPLMRNHEQPGEPSVALSIVERPQRLAEFWVLPAGSIAVPWPLPAGSIAVPWPLPDARPVI
jgi:hypothetical protein